MPRVEDIFLVVADETYNGEKVTWSHAHALMVSISLSSESSVCEGKLKIMSTLKSLKYEDASLKDFFAAAVFLVAVHLLQEVVIEALNAD